MSEEPDRVTVTIENGVADVRLNRPDKRNALDPTTFAAIAGAGERLKTEDGLRAVVLSGEGASFCAGLDFGAFQAMADDDGSSDVGAIGRVAEGQITHLGQQACWVWQEVPVPVIAAVHGHALGGGLQIALGADIRIAAPDAKLSVMEIRWGLIPDMGITQALPRLVRLDVAKELTFTGRRLSGEEALEAGLVTRVDADPQAAAQALATEIAAKSPDAVRSAKRLYQEAWDTTPAQALALETELQLKLIGSENQIAAVTAGMSGQPPQFTDPNGARYQAAPRPEAGQYRTGDRGASPPALLASGSQPATAL
ncbi:MAG: crotonase/enoyl-CoA hydratase family protein [Solirubrobacteraceae bacterium]